MTVASRLSRLLCQFFVLCFLIVGSQACLAWGAVGHRVIAQIAYDHLTPHAREEVERLNHALDNIAQTHTFATSANWPDWLFGHDITAFASWHYIDRGYSQDGTTVPSFDTHNVVWAINQSTRVLQSSRSNDIEKAIFLRFLIHFVGDIHQPLHCIDRYSREYPEGDDGGNLFLIDAGKTPNLHKLWDKGAGYFESFFKSYPHRAKQINVIAEEIEKRFPMSELKQQLMITDPNTWSLEGFQLAKLYAYSLEPGSKPSPEYILKAQEIVAKQSALAGYRLAQLLNRVVGS